MKPLPDLNNDVAMLERGKRSALGSARNEAAAMLRDACSYAQSSSWDDLAAHAEVAKRAADRLITLQAMWQELD